MRRAAERRTGDGTASNATTPSAMPSGVPSVTCPEPGGSTSSAAAPLVGTTTGTPQARASSVASPNVSARDGDSAMSAFAIIPASLARSAT